ncbi:Protein yippee-like [Rhynchospora pubera]|uniref:Protein yippee-like n=1 Tax=Rhynchospora pubera TaxID=906938 RepID=A0AAV8GT46_9POAL|nr:Protein yippee-like [Rhynchospora pubera]
MTSSPRTSTAGMERLISTTRCKCLLSPSCFLDHVIVNVTSGVREDRMMTTGMHTVCDIFCVGCGSVVGWKYIAAHEKSQKYKEGKFILERFKVYGPDGSQYWATHDSQVGGSSDPDDA